MRVGPLGLDEGIAVPVDADGLQVLDLTLRRPRALPVDVLDAQDETPPGCARPRPREDRGAQVPQVEIARGGGGESSGVRHAPSVRGHGLLPGSTFPRASEDVTIVEEGQASCEPPRTRVRTGRDPSCRRRLSSAVAIPSSGCPPYRRLARGLLRDSSPSPSSSERRCARLREMSGSCPGLVPPAEPDARLCEMSGSCPGLVLPFVD